MAVDGGVRAAVDDGAAARGDAQPVAVAPDTGVHVEVALAVAAVFRVVPELERHRGHGRAADQFADLVDQRLARIVEGFDPGAEAAALHLAQIHRQRDHAADEAAGEVGAAGDRVEPDVVADVVVYPLVALGRQRRTGGTDRAQLREVGDLVRLDVGLEAGEEEGRAGAEEADAGFADEAPQGVPVGPARIAVVDADGAAHQEAHHLAVPHDPAAARIPVEAVLRAEVEVQGAELDLLDDDTAVGMHDGLGQPRGARGIHDPERMVEGNMLHL